MESNDAPAPHAIPAIAAFSALHSGLRQRFIDLVVRYVNLTGKPEEGWYSEAWSLAEAHFEILEQQFLARKECDISQATLSAWWAQRYEDINRADHFVQAFCRDIVSVIETGGGPAVLQSLPTSTVDFRALTKPQQRELRTACLRLIQLVDTSLVHKLALDGSFSLADWLPTMEHIERKFDEVISFLPDRNRSLFEVARGWRARLAVQRITRAFWFGSQNPYRRHHPEFFAAMSEALLMRPEAHP